MSGTNDNTFLRDYYRGEYSMPESVLIAPDRGFRVSRLYEADQLGVTILIDQDGRVLWKGVWSGDDEKLFRAIQKAVKA